MINPHDPFNQLGRKAAPHGEPTNDPEQDGKGEEPAQDAEAPRQKRKYTRRVPPATNPQKPVAKPEEQEPELVAAIFTTGELTIYVGEDVMHLTVTQREKLEQFLGVTAPRVEASRPRRKCRVCQQRRDLDKFEGDSTVCKDCE